MKRMQSVITVRLPEEDIKTVEKISYEEKMDKSTMLRKLVELGEIYFAILKYKDGKISIGKAAEIANLPISHMIDIFSKLGIKSELEVIDYLEAKRNL